MTYNFINLKIEDGIAYVRLQDTVTNNEWNAPFIQELMDVAIYLRDHDSTKIVVISSSADDFSSGCNQKSFLEKDIPLQYQIVSLASDAIEQWAKLPYPIVMAIQGQCSSFAFSFACIADIRIITDDVQFSLPELSQGLIPAGGITQRLPRLIGKGAALSVLLGNHFLNADEAIALGFATKSTERDKLWNETFSEAKQLNELSTLSLQYTKECIYRGSELPFDQGLRLELDIYLLLQTTRDRMEGVEAFLQKRKPHFIGE